MACAGVAADADQNASFAGRAFNDSFWQNLPLDGHREQVSAGSGFQNLIRITTMAIGALLTSTYWDHMARFSPAELVVPTDPPAGAMPHAGLPTGARTFAFSKLIEHECRRCPCSRGSQPTCDSLLRANLGVLENSSGVAVFSAC